MRGSAVFLAVTVFANVSCAGFGLGMTGAVKKKTASLDQKVRDQRANSQGTSVAASIVVAAAASSSMTIVAGRPTSLVLSAYVHGASQVQLYDMTSGSPVKLGDMNDSGILGDRTAGDSIFSLRATLIETAAGMATLRVSASGAGATQTEDFTIRVVTITHPTSELAANQMANDLLHQAQTLQQLGTSIKNDMMNQTVTLATQQKFQQLDGIVAAMFVDFEGVTNLDVGDSLYAMMGVDSLSASAGTQQINTFVADPTASSVHDMEQYIITTWGYTEAELVAASKADRLTLAGQAQIYAPNLPYHKVVTNDLERSAIKGIGQELLSVVGDAIPALYNANEITSFVSGKTVDTLSDVYVDWYIDTHGNQNFIVGQAQSGEQFSVPSGSHNMLFSFGNGNARSVKENVTLPPQQTIGVNFAPGQLSVPLPPSGLSAQAGAGLSVSLHWTDNSSIESGFKIQRSADNISFSQVATVGKDIQSYTDGAIIAGNATYYYKVAANDAAGDSAFSNTASAFIAGIPPAAVNWSTITIDALVNPDEVSIAGEANGNLHVAYHVNNQSILKYAKWNGVSWSTQTVDTHALGSFGYSPTIRVDGNGTPQITYFDFVFPDLNIKYAKWNGVSWSTQTVDHAFSNSSMALDTSGNPHIVYFGDTGIKYASWTGVAWSTEIVTGLACGSNFSVTLDASNTPSISCELDEGSFFFDLRFAKRTNSLWSSQTVDAGVGNVVGTTDIVVDGFGIPTIAYGPGGYAKWNGVSWSTQTVDSSGSNLHIALDTTGAPHISYGSAFLKYAQWTGTAWNIQTIEFTGASLPNAIVLDASNNPQIVYNGSGTLKFAKGHP